MSPSLGSPRLHLRTTDSTNLQARRLAVAGAPHGTLVTAGEQTAGRGRQGRSWSAPAGRALLMSLVLRDPPPLLALAAGVAVARSVEALVAIGSAGAAASTAVAAVKWPNDVLLNGRKAAGTLVEGRPQDGWAVLGIGLNVAMRDEDLGSELARRAIGLGGEPGDVEHALATLLRELGGVLFADPTDVLSELRARDALRGRPVRWATGTGVGDGIDDRGRLLVATAEGTVALDAGEVHLDAVQPSP